MKNSPTEKTEAEIELPLAGFTGTPEEIERQWFEQVYRVLLLDEPFGALDPGIRVDMHDLVTRLWREHGLTVVMVTHDIAEAFKLGTRVLAFDKRRHDPHAPHRYGATATYDVPLLRKAAAAPDAKSA